MDSMCSIKTGDENDDDGDDRIGIQWKCVPFSSFFLSSFHLLAFGHKQNPPQENEREREKKEREKKGQEKWWHRDVIEK